MEPGYNGILPLAVNCHSSENINVTSSTCIKEKPSYNGENAVSYGSVTVRFHCIITPIYCGVHVSGYTCQLVKPSYMTFQHVVQRFW
jgi:hypothetical protein